MDTLEAIRKRRSVRQYKTGDIPRQDLETIVDAGRLAPTGYNRQPWDFIVVTERSTIFHFKMIYSWLETVSALIVVVMDKTSDWWVEDGAAAIENLLLAATALGYGSCWVEGDAMPYEETIKSLLGIPPDHHVMAVIPIGIPAEIPKPSKKSLQQVLHWEKY
jgi:nitroreductase